MEKCGDYTLQATVGWGERATYYAATGSSGSGTGGIVVSCCRSVVQRDSQAFLRSAAEQQIAVASSCHRTAPILDFGVTQSGRAYKVSIGYEASLAECILCGNVTNDVGLKSIVSGVLQALVELREKCHRAHGNLKAGNILLDEEGHVVLTDIAPFAKDATHVGDLYALGTIIYQLVRRSLNIGFLSPPLERSTAWTDALEDCADDWREFTNILLTRKPADEQKVLAEALRTLKSIDSLGEKAAPIATSVSGARPVAGSEKTPQKKKGKALFYILGVAACGTIGGFAWNRNKPIEQPVLKIPKVVFDRDGFTKRIAEQPKLKSNAGAYILENLKQAGSLREMEQELRGWPVTESLSAMATKWQTRGDGWKSIAKVLATDADISSLASGADDTEKAERLAKATAALGHADTTLASAEQLEKRWERIDGTCKRIVKIGIAGVPDFSQWAGAEISGAADLPKAHEHADAVEKSLNELLDSLSQEAPRILPAAFATRAKALIPPVGPDPKWPTKWRDAISQSLQPEKSILATWDESFASIEKRILGRPSAEHAGLRAKLKDVQAMSASALSSEELAISAQIEALRSSIRNPLADFDKAFRDLFESARAKLSASATTANSTAELNVFYGKLDALMKAEPYSVVSPSVLTHYGIDLRTMKAAFGTALSARTEPKFDFKPSPMGEWLPVGNIEGTSGAFKFKLTAANTESAPIIFHVLSNQRVAMAAIETPLSLARMSGAVPPPGTGPLQNRDSGAPSPGKRWLWPAAESWIASVDAVPDITPQEKRNILPRDTDPESCPVTWISPTDAWKIASNLGCELPRADDWAAAVTDSAQQNARLIGPVFKAVSGRIDAYSKPDSYNITRLSLPSEQGYPAGGAVNVIDLGQLWLTPCADTSGQFGKKFAHLIGNASEFVSASPTGPHAYVGGSCATPPDRAVRTPVATTNKRAFDITFRLVVPIIPGSEDAGRDALRVAVEAQLKAIADKGPMKL